VSDEDAGSISSKTGLKCVGRVDRLPPSYSNPNKDRYDSSFEEFLFSKGILDRYSEYGVCRPTKNRELKAVSRYGLPTVEIIPTEREMGIMFSWLCHEFGPSVEGSKVLPFEQVEIQSSTTPGIPYKWYHRSKGDALRHCSEDVDSFWRYGHLFRHKIMWHNFVKTELLPASKLEQDNARSITGPDIAYHMCTGRFYQDFNHRLYDSIWQHSSSLGFSKYYGGVSKLAAKINKHPHKEESDMAKYDARQARWIRELCLLFRWEMLAPEFKTQENWDRLAYYYREAVDSFIVLQLGYILQADHGMKSGDGNTSADNTLIHFMLLSLAYIRLVSEDYSHFKNNVEACLYGDDELISMSDEVVGTFSAAARAPIYESCGVHFKVESTVESTELTGLTFLGGRFKIDEDSGQYVQEPVQPRKILASLLKPHSKQTPGQTMVRAIALLCEAYWHEPTRELLHEFVQWLTSRGVQPDYSADFTTDDVVIPVDFFKGKVPTMRDYRSLWLGYE